MWRNTDLYGMDLRKVRTGGASSCQRACLSDRRCRAFTYHAGTCSLKTGLQGARPNETTFSGDVRR